MAGKTLPTVRADEGEDEEDALYRTAMSRREDRRAEGLSCLLVLCGIPKTSCQMPAVKVTNEAGSVVYFPLAHDVLARCGRQQPRCYRRSRLGVRPIGIKHAVRSVTWWDTRAPFWQCCSKFFAVVVSTMAHSLPVRHGTLMLWATSKRLPFSSPIASVRRLPKSQFSSCTN